MRVSGNDYKHGNPLKFCDRCGWRYHASQVRKEWTGLQTCEGPGTNGCWEPRHPQDKVRGKPDRQSFPDPRPEATDTFLAVGDVTPNDL